MSAFNVLEKLLGLFPVKHLCRMLFVASGLLLFLPNVVLESIGLSQYTDQNRHIFGIVLLLTASSFIAQILVNICKRIIQISKNFAAIKRQKRILQSLTDHEQKVLREFATSDRGELPFNRTNKAIVSLVDKGILLDLRPTLDEKLPNRYYRIAPAYMEHVNAYFGNFDC